MSADFTSLEELRKDSKRFSVLAEALADVNIGDMDPTQFFQREGNWTEAWRACIDAGMKQSAK